MLANLILYILICLFVAVAIRRIAQVCSIYETQAVDSPLKPRGMTRTH